MKNKIYILYTYPENSRYLDDVPYSVWFYECDKIKYILLNIDSEKFNTLCNSSLEEKDEILCGIIKQGRVNEDGRYFIEEDIPSIESIIGRSEINLKSEILKSLRVIKLNQLIK